MIKNKDDIVYLKIFTLMFLLFSFVLRAKNNNAENKNLIIEDVSHKVTTKKEPGYWEKLDTDSTS